MKNYQNHQPPEGINTSPDHPVLTFIKLLAGMIVVMLLVAWLLGFSGSWLAGLVPFEQELQLSEAYLDEDDVKGEVHPELAVYLEDLAERLTPGMNLPEGMKIRINYVPENVENAFATLGGNVLLYRGLLARLPNENSLAMLIAHEMAHVRLRHPIRSAGQSLAISTGIKLMMGYSDVDILGNTGLYTQLHFSRSMETDADEAGLTAVHSVYGHVNGAVDLYKTLREIGEDYGQEAASSAFFSTHPLDQERIYNLTRIATEQGWLDDKAVIQPLPPEFEDWLGDGSLSFSMGFDNL